MTIAHSITDYTLHYNQDVTLLGTCIQALVNPQLAKSVLPNFAAKVPVMHAVSTSSICCKSERVHVV